MTTSVILIILAALLVLMVLIMRRHRRKTDGTPHEVEPCVAGGGCCGGANCHRKGQDDHHRAAKLAYFEDEELDRYQGRAADDYSPADVDEWREVLTTLRSSEVSDWVTSIHRRQLLIPEALQPLVKERLGEDDR